MSKTILWRRLDSSTQSEIQTASECGFRCITNRVFIEKKDTVIGRYSVLPFYREIVEDIKLLGATLINSPEQHNYIADLSQWYEDLRGLTPETFLPESAPDIPLIVKGETNSKKFLWDTHMYAPNKKAAIEVMCRLMDDTLIEQQKIYFREYVPLRRLTTGEHRLPICEEYRFFIYRNTILSGGFYWSSHLSDISESVHPSRVPREFLKEVINRVRGKTNFWVVDVGIKEDGNPIVIELNDGQMSGLSENDPKEMYSNLYRALNEEI